MRKLKYIKNIKDSLNEAHINSYGELQDMDYELSSDDLWDDNEYLFFVRDNLENGSEMPESFYNKISDNHKKLYRKELLDFGGSLIAFSENISLIKDLIEYDYKRLEGEILEWIKMYSTFGNDHFPFSDAFIENIDEILQGKIINKITEVMEWDLELPKSTFYKLHSRVRKMIEKNNFKPFNIYFF